MLLVCLLTSCLMSDYLRSSLRHMRETEQHCPIVQDNVTRNYSQDIKLSANHCQRSMAYAHQHYLHIIDISPIIMIQVSGWSYRGLLAVLSSLFYLSWTPFSLMIKYICP